MSGVDALTSKPQRGEPFVCTTGCHGGDFADFDHFCDALGVTQDEAPVAFGEWLSGRTGRVVLARRVETAP